MKQEFRNQVFKTIRELSAVYVEFGDMVCEAGTDEKETSPGSGMYRCHTDYPKEWNKACDAIDNAISELNESVGRPRHA